MIHIVAASSVSALGCDPKVVISRVAAGQIPHFYHNRALLKNRRGTFVARVRGDLSACGRRIADLGLEEHNSRNNRLLLRALSPVTHEFHEAVRRFGEDRIAIVMGTSTSGLDEADRAVSGLEFSDGGSWRYPMQELGDPSRFLRAYLGLGNPCYTISTACTSSARALISGARLIESGMADAVLVGGCDTLSRMPLNGFAAMGVLSERRCVPFSKDRDGISIGEAAGIMLLSREAFGSHGVFLAGYGESSDAYHISSPDPSGAGALTAMKEAMSRAGIGPADLGYVNLHGTGTVMNDAMEAAAVHDLLGDHVPCSSTKHLTGHTLGAAGITEAALLYFMLSQDRYPLPSQDFRESPRDPKLPGINLVDEPGQHGCGDFLMSNSFAFGGNNAAIILGRR